MRGQTNEHYLRPVPQEEDQRIGKIETTPIFYGQPPRPFHPNDREGMLSFLRLKNSVPYEAPLSLDSGKCVIPFGYHEDRRKGKVDSQRDQHQDALRRIEARKLHVRRLRAPWPGGEWIE